jgi:hypothetical protein
MNGTTFHKCRPRIGMFGIKSLFHAILLIVVLATAGCGVFQLPQCPPAKQPLFDEPTKTVDLGSKQVECG